MDSNPFTNIFEDLPLTAFQILKNIGHGIIVTDIEGEIIFWNNASEQIFGYSSEEVIGKHVSLLYPDSDEKRFLNDLENLESGEIISHQWRGQHKDGSMIWVDTQKKVIHDEKKRPLVVIGSASDIEERKELEVDLEESRARAQVILDETVDAIITISVDGIIQSFNKAAERIFGYSEEEAVGENVKMLMPPPHNEKHDEYLENYRRTGIKKVIGMWREERAMRKDGTIFPIELSISEVSWKGNEIYTGILRDITKRRKLENEIIKASEEERRRIGQDLHDGLGQMLTGIGLISRNLANKLEANGLPGAGEVKEISEMIREADEYARSLSHSLVPVDVDEEGLRDALNKLTSRAAKLFDINCAFEERGEVKIERKNISLHFYRIAQEAINNAVKHGNADEIKVLLIGNSRSIKLIIKDDGSGFSDEFRLSSRNGLGINTMQYRTHVLGGSLSIDEDQEGWTRIVCKVPYH